MAVLRWVLAAAAAAAVREEALDLDLDCCHREDYRLRATAVHLPCGVASFLMTCPQTF